MGPRVRYRRPPQFPAQHSSQPGPAGREQVEYTGACMVPGHGKRVLPDNDVLSGDLRLALRGAVSGPELTRRTVLQPTPSGSTPANREREQRLEAQLSRGEADGEIWASRVPEATQLRFSCVASRLALCFRIVGYDFVFVGDSPDPTPVCCSPLYRTRTVASFAVRLGVLQESVGNADLCFRLVNEGLIRPRVDVKQKVALIDLHPCFEGNIIQVSGNTH